MNELRLCLSPGGPASCSLTKKCARRQCHTEYVLVPVPKNIDIASSFICIICTANDY